MTKTKLTDAQRAALKILADGSWHCTAKATSNDVVHGGVAKYLIGRGFARAFEKKLLRELELVFVRITPAGYKALKESK